MSGADHHIGHVGPGGPDGSAGPDGPDGRAATAYEPFDVCGPLPEGTTLLEASAGTGKTYTIGALVARYVAEGHAVLDELLVVTFGRAASLELRERVRAQLVRAERALADPEAARAGADTLIGLLADVPDAEVAIRRRRLATALADFDAATIATTHQFCQQVLTGLGVAGDSEPDAELVESLEDLVTEVVDDLYVAKYAAPGADEPPFNRAEALEIARTAVAHPHARLEPADAPQDSPAAVRYGLASAVRKEVDRRKRQRGLLAYDDLLGQVAVALERADAPARDRMRARWKIVLVDEFQDTDPVQWEVLDRAFSGHATVVLIGDPKQAIYAFRGGDVVAYLNAAHTATTKRTLAANWRADKPLVDALYATIGGAELGDPAIVVHQVEAAHSGSRLTGAPVDAPLRLRVVRRTDVGYAPAADVPIAPLRAFVAEDLATDIAALLAAGAEFAGRPLGPGDVAVLVSRHAQAREVQAALRAERIPAVIAGAGSVYATPAATDWLRLLEALDAPQRSLRTRAAALTPFLGRTAADLGTAGETLTDELGETLRAWSDLAERRGIAAVLEVAASTTGLAERLLAETGGERHLTDLRHVGEGLHAAAVEDGLGVAALLEWLRRRRDEAGADGGAPSADRARRLASDAAAVQVVTLHASKGLQYPVVYLPFAFDHWDPDPKLPLLHDGAERVLDVGGRGAPGAPERARRALAERSGEALRLLYVGLTRAQSQVITWWAPSARNTPSSGLHRLLFGRSIASGAVADRVPVPPDDVAATQLAAFERAGGPVIEVAGSPLPGGARRTTARDVRPAALSAALSVARFARSVDTSWRRVSYSSIAAGEEYAPHGVGSEPETTERDDEELPPTAEFTEFAEFAESLEAASAPEPAPAGTTEEALRALPSPMASLPGGTAFGTLVHAVLEHTDPQAPDLRAELTRHCTEQLARHPLPVPAAELAIALEPVLHSSLGPLAGDLTLADVAVADRLAELDFELPLAGGDHTRGQVRVGDLVPVLRRHLRAPDPLAGYADRLAAPALADQPLRGYLTGSLDVVLRLPGPRFVVADYKTNWLGPLDADLTLWDYRPEATAEVMATSHYPLQALLYAVALHRFLRWRMPAYEPTTHLAGVLYLFVRGMGGADVPRVGDAPCGVFSWRPPDALLDEVSALLDGSTAR